MKQQTKDNIRGINVLAQLVCIVVLAFMGSVYGFNEKTGHAMACYFMAIWWRIGYLEMIRNYNKPVKSKSTTRAIIERINIWHTNN